MQSDNKLFDDMAKVMSGAMGTVFDSKKEIEAAFKEKIRDIMGDSDMVSREEFEAVKEMAAKARLEQEKLKTRLTSLEKKLKKGKK